MKGDAEGGAAWGRASGRGSPQRGGGAGRAMGVRHAGDILRRCPQKGLRPGGGGGRGRCRKRKTGRKGEGEREWRKKRVGEEERERRKEEGRKPANRKRR